MFEKFPQLFRVHVAGAFSYINKHRHGTYLGYGFGGGDKGVGNGDDLVSGPHAGSHESKPQCIGSRIDTDAEFRPAEFGEFFLKTGDIGSTDKGTVFHGLFDHGQNFGFDLFILSFQVKKRHLHGWSSLYSNEIFLISVLSDLLVLMTT